MVVGGGGGLHRKSDTASTAATDSTHQQHSSITAQDDNPTAETVAPRFQQESQPQSVNNDEALQQQPSPQHSSHQHQEINAMPIIAVQSQFNDLAIQGHDQEEVAGAHLDPNSSTLAQECRAVPGLVELDDRLPSTSTLPSSHPPPLDLQESVSYVKMLNPDGTESGSVIEIRMTPNVSPSQPLSEPVLIEPPSTEDPSLVVVHFNPAIQHGIPGKAGDLPTIHSPSPTHARETEVEGAGDSPTSGHQDVQGPVRHMQEDLRFSGSSDRTSTTIPRSMIASAQSGQTALSLIDSSPTFMSASKAHPQPGSSSTATSSVPSTVSPNSRPVIAAAQQSQQHPSKLTSTPAFLCAMPTTSIEQQSLDELERMRLMQVHDYQQQQHEQFMRNRQRQLQLQAQQRVMAAAPYHQLDRQFTPSNSPGRVLMLRPMHPVQLPPSNSTPQPPSTHRPPFSPPPHAPGQPPIRVTMHATPPRPQFRPLQHRPSPHSPPRTMLSSTAVSPTMTRRQPPAYSSSTQVDMRIGSEVHSNQGSGIDRAGDSHANHINHEPITGSATSTTENSNSDTKQQSQLENDRWDARPPRATKRMYYFLCMVRVALVLFPFHGYMQEHELDFPEVMAGTT
jgi:predicted DNA-binding protein (UPF0251 family)